MAKQRHRRPYGRHRRDYGCCPGHDLYPSETYNSRRSKKARSRDNAKMHRAFRRTSKQELAHGPEATDERLS
ncbi:MULTISPECIES: hypothetical protein [unclassified Bradyrhizobium]|uniref:hypothetical protein n=1 Tax=unclassified Bradyrhizobium TaxID=2631580 RepID=UPI0028EB79FF|nr:MULTISPECIES: hypothetical protein [unclassified Bradyrhizobium]